MDTTITSYLKDIQLIYKEKKDYLNKREEPNQALKMLRKDHQCQLKVHRYQTHNQEDNGH